MTRFNHIIRELGRNLCRHPFTAFGLLMSLVMIFLLFDLFWIAVGTSEKLYFELLSDMQMEAFISEETPETALEDFHKSLEKMDGVIKVNYVSKNNAREELSHLIGTDLLVGYEKNNPLPRSFILSFDRPYLNSSALSDFEDSLQIKPEIAQVSYSSRWLLKAENARRVVWNIGMLIGGVILAVALLSSIISIRLMTETRVLGFRRMRLLGAGRLFIAAPFLLEGFFISGIAAVIGWSLVAIFLREVTFTRLELVVPEFQQIILYCGLTALLGMISGFLGIRKTLA